MKRFLRNAKVLLGLWGVCVSISYYIFPFSALHPAMEFCSPPVISMVLPAVNYERDTTELSALYERGLRAGCYSGVKSLSAKVSGASAVALKAVVHDALERLILRNERELVGWVIDHEDIDLNQNLSNGETPLLSATLDEAFDVAKLLLDRGANPIVGASRAPMNVAAIRKNPQWVMAFARWGLRNRVSLHSDACVMRHFLSSHPRKVQVVRMLLNSGVAPVCEADNSITAISIAVEKQSLDVFEALIDSRPSLNLKELEHVDTAVLKRKDPKLQKRWDEYRGRKSQ